MIIQQRSSVLLLLLALTAAPALASLTVANKDLTVVQGETKTFVLVLSESTSVSVEVRFDVQHSDLVRVEPTEFNISAGSSPQEWNITVYGLESGHSTISANATPSDAIDDYFLNFDRPLATTESPIDWASILSEFDEDSDRTFCCVNRAESLDRTTDAFVRVTIEKSEALYHVSAVVGWVYFLAWSVSFYPQIYINYKRKSVVGLNFDFLSLNIVGFIMYSLFNCGLYWIPEVEEEYFNRYPKGLNPVQVNDIFFALHAVVATSVTIFQCFIYERGTQRVSITARVIHSVFAIFILISIILAATSTIAWLDFLYYCSYVKLAITLIKYVPQAFYNYKRKSTIGWSIGNIFLDFTGGMLSMLQMILNAYNYNDWESIFGDPTKFGLGFFSVAFDIFFLIQHYGLYRHTSEKQIDLNGRV